ncbi:MAG: DUF4118 domain-containing protein [Butyricicoccus sp.]|nr:DUF4118 domain-containing protein [Butyricicoccus sp.]
MDRKKKNRTFHDAVFTLFVMIVVFGVNLLVGSYYNALSLVPMISVLGVFLISLQTIGYVWGILAAIVNVFVVNYAFTFPYYAFNFSLPENLFSAIIMMGVAAMTSALTTKIKEQEKIRTETEREKTRANLLRAISHDIRTPLTSISGSTSTIIDNYDLLTREQHIKLLREIREDSDWLIRMVENLLSITRIDGERVQVIKTATMLDELIDSSLVKFQKRYPNQEVIVRIPDDILCVSVDAMLIEQVIINLLENAVIHAHNMTELQLTVYSKERYAVFEIADDGSGIPPERISNLFTGYHDRTDAPTDGKRSNMGIGLSVCATIIRAHGGIIQAENRPQGGAVFRFTLETEEVDLE